MSGEKLSLDTTVSSAAYYLLNPFPSFPFMLKKMIRLKENKPPSTHPYNSSAVNRDTSEEHSI